MGVPAFYRWLSEKYPKIVVDVLVERVQLANGSYTQKLPFDSTRPNPNGFECNNLYIDMNGIIHPCSHPENGPQPASEEEMYENICEYVDHLMRVHRPRSLLYLAIDGVAPRAKMNQQRARRFRSAQEARELAALEKEIRCEVYSLDDEDENKSQDKKEDDKKTGAWDSNVITPGTPFMIKLAEYIRFYIRLRISTNPAWKTIKVIFSDASLPGEGEHKIMNHIRCQRACPGYNPNTVHVLHGLDADLIMLALATHEVHFYISREEVTFGRRSEEAKEKRQLESGYRQKQQEYDEVAGDAAMQLIENQHKPIQLLSIPILREYIAIEFQSLMQRIPFQPVSLERLIDDFVFMCFFVGNDFLPHLPSLDIRDGALDFLLNVYQRILPTLGDYITRSGGFVNLSHVDIILNEVGQIEDYVFQMKHEAEQTEKRRRQEMDENKKAKNARNKDAPPPIVSTSEVPKVRGRAARILEKQSRNIVSNNSNNDEQSGNANGCAAVDAIALQSKRRQHVGNTHILFDDNGNTRVKTTNVNGKGTIVPSHLKKTVLDDKQNENAAKELKLALKTGTTNTASDNLMTNAENSETMTLDVPIATGDNEQVEVSTLPSDDVAVDDDKDTNNKKRTYNMLEGDNGTIVMSDIGQVTNEDVGFDADDDDDEDEDDVVAPKINEIVKKVDPKLALIVKEKVKMAQQKQLDEYSKSVVDNVRLHEEGWKDRYYSDKCKADDVKNHGGREHLFRSYVMGLCWVMKYYYDGVPSWKWYYPFHYGPFASDLRNIERFENDCKSFEVSTPFNPVEQLMAVLPSDSSHAIPKASRWLMCDPESPIIDFYPTEVPVDPNGKAMPWLWVVLLPFINEERLLSAVSPTMSKWTPEELLCNARGLDDGYLYLHRSMSNVLSNKISSILMQAAKNNNKGSSMTKVRLTNATQYGISGSVRPPLKNEFFPPDENVVIPLPPTASKINKIASDTIFSDPIESNEATCVAFTEPPKLSHKSILLAGVAIPPPTLITPEDQLIRRPRLNRFGGSIANLGGGNTFRQGQSHQSGYGSMNISQYERDLARQNGRGNEMYQAGTRTWGSMEPTPKKFHSNNNNGAMPLLQQPPPPPPGYPYQQQHVQNQWGQLQLTHHQQRPPQLSGNVGMHYQAQQQRAQNLPPVRQIPGYNQNNNRGQFNVGSSNQHQRFVQRSTIPLPPPPPPQQQQYGHNFRSFNNPSASASYRQPQQQQHQYQQRPSQQPPARANADVMNSLRAQLASTLQHQNRNKNGGNNNYNGNNPRGR